MGIAASSDLGYANPLLRLLALGPKNERRCGPCRRADHEKCVGIACRCTATKRCQANERLVVDREGPLP